MILQNILANLIRRKSPVVFNDINRIRPVSSLFGFDRGKPIDRYYIEKFLEQNSSMISGHVLEIGDDLYTKRYGGAGVTVSNVLTAPPTSKSNAFVGDLTDFNTLKAASFDCFICTQTLNCIYDIQKAVVNVNYMLKTGGVFLGTVPGISQISRYDMDRWGEYWRFTTASIQNLFKPVFGDSVLVESHGNCLAACSLLQGLAVEDLPDCTLLDNYDPDYQVIITIVARKNS